MVQRDTPGDARGPWVATRRQHNRRTSMRKTHLLAAAALVAGAAALPAAAQDKVTYLTNWLAQGEHGGWYQAVADGTYAKYGLDVTIEQGGPQSQGLAKLISGNVTFYMGGVSSAIDGVVQG